ncbi:hypothetical protein BU24DRAFT_194461 [Aaosphaeria arxii CBS 175.79]|uniref:DUF7137 domain-containing protein n=1 Tax=Aaosphaeria arxii CBS 175.79 TaxID=1450172 RepID=A0A6A5XSH7_9PLEO|nr:uncharacterized protein BU24DRAFT_194461 [Aaosphaeria arxii CBS 175.79]KAF2016132.1 hypothetical protein BU24DRAFT_194461 [Aaosphaeria arxii CBS 175.79]
MRPAQLLAAVVALSSVTAAWPDMFDHTNAISPVKNVIYGRQDNSESTEPSKTAEPKSSATDGKPEKTEDPKETNSGSASATATGKDKASQTGKASGTASATKSKSKSIAPDKPAGGIQMITPEAIAGPQYYKIGDWVTFAWNYTSLLVTPKAIDIMATCTKNQATYTLAVNQSVEETGRILWDTSKDKDSNNPLLTEMYTLLVYDSESDVTAIPSPGHLGSANSFRFGLYQPQKYVPWAEFECANCNGAMGTLTLNALFITCATTFGSLLYFAYSFGAF